MLLVQTANSHDPPLFRILGCELAALFTRTEVAFLEYYQIGRLSRRHGQALLDMLRHPEFDPNDFRSTDFVHLLRRLESPYAESILHTYNLWNEGDGNYKLDLVVRDYLEVFREVMRKPRCVRHLLLAQRQSRTAAAEPSLGAAQLPSGSELRR